MLKALTKVNEFVPSLSGGVVIHFLYKLFKTTLSCGCNQKSDSTAMTSNKQSEKSDSTALSGHSNTHDVDKQNHIKL